jgi:uncharacterized membrane protein
MLSSYARAFSLRSPQRFFTAFWPDVPDGPLMNVWPDSFSGSVIQIPLRNSDMDRIVLEFINLFCTGLFAGIEFIVCFGVRGPLNVLDDQPHIQIRQALIRRLRVLVPAVFLPTAISGVTVAVLEGTAPGFVFRCAGACAVLAWTLATFNGTVAINEAVLTWRPDAPPANWKAIIRRWERLDLVRTWAALTAFACFLTAVALRLAGIPAGH